ncbi:MAG TPA: glycine zipper 2TM domain-containing protein [Novosphingobium sp.]|nr:glycine zipper 2TM domain-containing protein [Novosphingobium sp.]
MRTNLTKAMLALAVPGLLATTIPASAAIGGNAVALSHAANAAVQADSWNHGDRGRHRGHHKNDRYDRGYQGSDYQGGYGSYGGNYNQRTSYEEPVRSNTRVWQGDNGQYYCQRSNGTTGLLIGGAAGALLGREIAGRGGDRTLGAILGAAGGALLGRQIDRGGSRCR